MNTLKKFGLVGLLVQTVGLMTFATTAKALPIDGTVLDASSGYSVVHGGSNPGGSGNSADWLWFDSGQSLSFDLTAGIISLSGNQSFSLTSQNGGTGSIELTGLDLDLNDVTDGFATGTLDYILDGSQMGTFNFSNDNYGSSLFNSSSFDGTNLEFYIWGGDSQHNIGIDLGVTGVVVEPDPNPVPAPASLLLCLLALGALRWTRPTALTVRS